VTRIAAKPLICISVGATLACVLSGCASGGGRGPVEKIKDEALSAGRVADPASFPFADEDFFHDMDQTRDGPLQLTKSQIQGRDMWMVWTGGDDRLWDALNWKSFGTFDLLRTISSYGPVFGRHNRWEYLRVVNEPCFEEPKQGDPERFGLWLDKRIPGCDARFDGKDPFADETKYKGVKYGHRGEEMPVGSFYGYPTGILGLRLLPNPDFDAKAKARWDAKRYYENDPALCDERPGTALQDRNGMRFLPRRSQSSQASGGPGQSQMGEPELQRWRAVFLVQPDLWMAGR